MFRILKASSKLVDTHVDGLEQIDVINVRVLRFIVLKFMNACGILVVEVCVAGRHLTRFTDGRPMGCGGSRYCRLRRRFRAFCGRHTVVRAWNALESRAFPNRYADPTDEDYYSVRPF